MFFLPFFFLLLSCYSDLILLNTMFTQYMWSDQNAVWPYYPSSILYSPQFLFNIFNALFSFLFLPVWNLFRSLRALKDFKYIMA